VAAVAMTARQVAELVGARIPRRPETVDQFLAGDPDREISGVAVTMMATYDVLRRAAAAGLDLVITHEPLYWNHLGAPGLTAGYAAAGDPVYAAKSALVAEHGLVVWHMHDSWHDDRPDGITTGTARALGWLGREVSDEPATYRLEPTTLADLAAHVGTALGAVALRYIGDPAQPVATVALQPGFWGFEKNRPALARPGVDVLVIGEAHEWETHEYATDAADAGFGKGLVVVGHIPSEQEGMREAAAWLADLLPGLPVKLVPARDPYHHP
jgi:putative NIF3 family GTP cyclohydrolase 1 type 2